MAESKKTDAGQREAQKLVDTAHEKGYLGTAVDPIPNEEYSLQSGPESPSAEEGVRAVQHTFTDENRKERANA